MRLRRGRRLERQAGYGGNCCKMHFQKGVNEKVAKNGGGEKNEFLKGGRGEDGQWTPFFMQHINPLCLNLYLFPYIFNVLLIFLYKFCE